MDLNRVLISLVAVHCSWILFQRPGRLWVIKLVLVLALLGSMWYGNREWAGLVAIGPWLVLILLPMILQRYTLLMMQTRRLGWATALSWILRVLHPVHSAIAMNQWVRVIRRVYALDFAGARQMMTILPLRDPAIDIWLHVIDAQQRGAWAELEAWLDKQWLDGGAGHAVLVGAKLSALAERSDWPTFARLLGSLELDDHNDALRVRALALLGDRAGVEALLRSHGNEFPRESRQLWLAVASMARGDLAEGRTRLQQLREWASPLLRLEIDRRLEQVVHGPSIDTLPEESQTIIRATQQHVHHEARYAVLGGLQTRWPIATGMLMVVLLLAFAVEIRNGWDQSLDEEALTTLGALIIPMEPPNDQWWRVGTYGLLHFGPLHLGFNLLGLYYLGRRVERSVGAAGLLVGFASSVVVAGMAIARWPQLAAAEEGTQAILVGASGGVMGLMGALLGMLWVGRRIHPTDRIRAQFGLAIQLIVLQTLIDFSTPQISGPCHLIGAATGLVLSVLFSTLAEWTHRTNPAA